MEMDGGTHTHGMMTPAPSANGTGAANMYNMVMHMSFYWGSESVILFSEWPGSDPGMYALALVLVFFMSIVVEWLSHYKLIRARSSHVVTGLAHTLAHVVRVGLGYMVMLAVMSFNVGVLLVAVAGHGVGFLFFGSQVFKKADGVTDIPPMTC